MGGGDEFLDAEGGGAALAQIGNALGTLGSMDLAQARRGLRRLGRARRSLRGLCGAPDCTSHAAPRARRALAHPHAANSACRPPQMGSADMEQLLQGVDVEELVGHQLFPGAVEPGGLGSNAHDVLLRLMEAPGLLAQVMGGGGGGGGGAGAGAGAPTDEAPRAGEQGPGQQQQQQGADGPPAGN